MTLEHPTSLVRKISVMLPSLISDSELKRMLASLQARRDVKALVLVVYSSNISGLKYSFKVPRVSEAVFEVFECDCRV